ncbi:hypothetical protein [Halorarum halobium]|uniref:hypothetical protein n=1 Tax=Halorarum halobium TaxID=3075121 RepID=UPI0028A9A6BE|nr:hypothetical protein [Halobaculum sp. XH14]
MSDAPDPREALLDEFTEQTDLRDLVSGDDLTERLDLESLGRAVGRALGATVGRRLGRELSRRVRSAVPFVGGSDRDRPSVGRVLEALAVAVVRTVSRPPYRGAIGDALSALVEKREAAREAAESAESTVEDATEAAGETAESATETAGETAESAADAASDAGSSAADVLPTDRDDIKRDTYRELLEVLSYSDLQSVAKSVDVTANLSREEMIDAIVEEFSAGDVERGEGESEDDGEGDGDEANDDGDEANDDGDEANDDGDEANDDGEDDGNGADGGSD